MREFESKRRLKNALYSRWSIGVLLLILALVSNAAWGVYEKKEGSEKAKKQAEEELSKLEARRAMLAAEIASLNTTEGIEREIRDKFRMAKEGEELVVILAGEASSTEKVEKEGWFARLLHYFR